MENNTIYSKVSSVFEDVLEHNNFKLEETTTANDVEGWDSITHMMIITEVETVFGIKFKLFDLMNMNNVGDLIKIIQTEL